MTQCSTLVKCDTTSVLLRTDNQKHREYFPSGTSSLLELYRLHVSVQIVAYFKKCVSRLPSASGYPSRCCVVVYKGNLIPKLQEMFWCVATIFRTHQMLTKKGNICACSQRFFANEHSKEKWCWRTLSSPSQRKLTQLTFTVRNASCGKTLRCTSQWM